MYRRGFLAAAGTLTLSGCVGSSVLSGQPEPQPRHAIEIDYAHAWAGELELTTNDGARTESIDGDGPDRIPIPDDARHVRATARKIDTPEGTLRIRLLEDSEVQGHADIDAGWGEAAVNAPLE